MSDLGKIEVELLGIDTPQKYIEVRNKLAFAKSILRTLDTLLEEKGLEMIEGFGPIEDGEMLYRIAYDASYKAKKKPKEMAQGILDALDGDWDGFAECLASGAFKHGALRSMLEDRNNADRFDDFFERVEKKTVEGRPIKKVLAVNKRFAAKSA